MNLTERDEWTAEEARIDRGLSATLNRTPEPALPSTIVAKARRCIRTRRLRRRAAFGLTMSAALLLASAVGWGLFGSVDEAIGPSHAGADPSVGRSDSEWEREISLALNAPPPVESFAALDRRMRATLATLDERETGR